MENACISLRVSILHHSVFMWFTYSEYIPCITGVAFLIHTTLTLDYNYITRLSFLKLNERLKIFYFQWGSRYFGGIPLWYKVKIRCHIYHEHVSVDVSCDNIMTCFPYGKTIKKVVRSIIFCGGSLLKCLLKNINNYLYMDVHYRDLSLIESCF